MRDYYELLGVAPDATRDCIRVAYRLLVARAHPDVNAAGDAEIETAALNEAWSVLREPATRAAYDAARLATSAALRCQRCGAGTPNLRFVAFARARGTGVPRHDGAMVCSACQRIEAREAAFSSLLRGNYATNRSRRLTFGAIARDVRGGKVDANTSAALLRQIGFVFARENRSNEALSALEAVLKFGPDPAVERIVARLREAGARVAEAGVSGPGVSGAGGAEHNAGRRFALPKQALLLASVACAVLFVAALGWLTIGRVARGPAVAPITSALPNIDPALRDEVRRLAGVVRVADVPPDRALYLFDLSSNREFAFAYEAAVATLPPTDRARNRWLVTLETTSQPSDAVEASPAQRYVLARGCAPERCNAGFVGIAYNATTRSVAGAAYFDGRWHEFGSDVPADRAMLVLAIARSRLPLVPRFTLDTANRSDIKQYVDAMRS